MKSFNIAMTICLIFTSLPLALFYGYFDLAMLFGAITSFVGVYVLFRYFRIDSASFLELAERHRLGLIINGFVLAVTFPIAAALTIKFFHLDPLRDIPGLAAISVVIGFSSGGTMSILYGLLGALLLQSSKEFKMFGPPTDTEETEKS